MLPGASLLDELQGVVESGLSYDYTLLECKLAPICPFRIPSAEALEQYVVALEKANPFAFNLSGICSQPLGFFLFTRFLIEDKKTLLLGEFLRDIAAFQTRCGHNQFNDQFLEHIIFKYFRHERAAMTKPCFVAFTAHLIFPPAAPLGEEEIVLHLATAADKKERIPTSIYDLTHIDRFRSQKIYLDSQSADLVTAEALPRIAQAVFGQIASQYGEAFKASAAYETYLQYKCIVDTMEGKEEDYLPLRSISKGGSGRVVAARNVFTGKLCAIKCMTKKRLKYHKSFAMCLEERRFLSAVDSPYVLGLQCAFVTPLMVSLVSNLLTGGSLDHHLLLAPFSTEQIRYYAARLILGLAALHKQGIVYRDLKPLNIMLDADGRSKIVDLGGAAKMKTEGLRDICGTRGYWAPEMIKEGDDARPYGYAVDWFSLGVCIFEFFTGTCPFITPVALKLSDPANAQGSVIHHHNHLHDRKSIGWQRAVDHATITFIVDVSVIPDLQAADFVSKLLEKDPSKRLGAGGVEELTNHPWFAGLDWAGLDSMDPPFVPSRESSNVPLSEIEEFSDDEEVSSIRLHKEDHAIFAKWSYVNRNGMQRDIVDYLEHQGAHGRYAFANPRASAFCIVQ